MGLLLRFVIYSFYPTIAIGCFLFAENCIIDICSILMNVLMCISSYIILQTELCKIKPMFIYHLRREPAVALNRHVNEMIQQERCLVVKGGFVVALRQILVQRGLDQ